MKLLVYFFVITVFTFGAFFVFFNKIYVYYWITTSKNYIEEHIDNHKPVELKLVDGNGSIKEFSPYIFEDVPSAQAVLDSLGIYYSVAKVATEDRWKFKNRTFDISKHIQNAVNCKKHSPYKKPLSKTNYLNYVLPYRAGNETLVEYGDTIDQLFLNMCESMKAESATVDHIVDSINCKLSTIVQYDARSQILLNEADPITTLKSGKGSCIAMTQLATLALRRYGIATVIDECPFWGHRASGHQWNAYLSDEQLWVPFNGSERSPDFFDPFNDSIKAPKIYRQTYSSQVGFSPNMISRENTPPLFRRNNRIDVTSNYVSTSHIWLDISVNFDDEEYVYLSVFNNQEWVIVSWAKIMNENTLFRDMGNNKIIYLPVFYRNGIITPAQKPFLIDKEEIVVFDHTEGKPTTLYVECVTQYYDHEWNYEIVEKDALYDLYVWDNEWVSVGQSKTSSNGQLIFHDLPSKGLFFLKSNVMDNRQHRLFSIIDGEQVWY